jgi:hypothetical protein
VLLPLEPRCWRVRLSLRALELDAAVQPFARLHPSLQNARLSLPPRSTPSTDMMTRRCASVSRRPQVGLALDLARDEQAPSCGVISPACVRAVPSRSGRRLAPLCALSSCASSLERFSRSNERDTKARSARPSFRHGLVAISAKERRNFEVSRPYARRLPPRYQAWPRHLALPLQGRLSAGSPCITLLGFVGFKVESSLVSHEYQQLIPVRNQRIFCA